MLMAASRLRLPSHGIARALVLRSHPASTSIAGGIASMESSKRGRALPISTQFETSEARDEVYLVGGIRTVT